jgi:hypothetical protein
LALLFNLLEPGGILYFSDSIKRCASQVTQYIESPLTTTFQELGFTLLKKEGWNWHYDQDSDHFVVEAFLLQKPKNN